MTSRILPLVAGVLAACGGSSTTSPVVQGPPQPAATVNATPQLAFTPSTVSIVPGGTVTFAFGAVAHDVFFDNDPAGAPENIPGTNSGTSIARTFTTPGTYSYNCHIHPGMHGTVNVVAAGTP